MKRIFGRVLSVCLAACAVGAALPACVENDQSIFIRGVLAPSSNRQNGTCLYTDDPQQPALLQGTFDVGITDSYFAIALVGSQMIGRGDPQNTRAESNRVHINGAVVKVSEPDGAQIAEFTSLATGFADVQQNNNPDFGLMGVVAIDAPTARNLAGQIGNNRATTKLVVVNMKAFGKTLGGVDLESSEFQFPIRVCNGCLVTRILDPDLPGQACPSTTNASGGASGGGTTQSPCTLGQDESVPCQLCRGKAVCDTL
jgi:hypothetical protein